MKERGLERNEEKIVLALEYFLFTVTIPPATLSDQIMYPNFFEY
jgi:hypothetical protein